MIDYLGLAARLKQRYHEHGVAGCTNRGLMREAAEALLFSLPETGWQPMATARGRTEPFLLSFADGHVEMVGGWHEYEELLGYGQPIAFGWQPLPAPLTNPAGVRADAALREAAKMENWNAAIDKAKAFVAALAARIDPKELADYDKYFGPDQTSEAAPEAQPDFTLSMKTRAIVVRGEAFVHESALKEWADISKKLEALGVRVTRLAP